MKFFSSRVYGSGNFRSNKKWSFLKGFTLIELLVVISIIGLLSSIVLASLNSARGKGSNSAIKANLHNMRAQAQLYYEDNGLAYGAGSAVGSCATASTLFINSTITSMVNAAQSANGGTALTCYNTSQAWAVYSPLKVSETVGGNTYTGWCVDWNGNSKGRTAAQGAITSTAC